ncbi:MAG: ribonuclease III [Clostridiales bacterium]|nr:ribonuclease III [Clostridiales bacterium]
MGKLNMGKKNAPLADDVARFMKELDFPAAKWPLLQKALTHPTYFEGVKQEEPEDNQRLEFLGDAVLDMVVGEYLYRAYPHAREGDLSKMRAALVCEATLARLASELGLGKLLRLGKGGEAGGDRERPSVLADACEALIGAIYISGGLAAAQAFIERHFAAAMKNITRDDIEDSKSLLQELTQREAGHGVTYKLMQMKGPDHAPHFESGAYCKDVLVGRGWGGSKKESEQSAAAAALATREKWLPGLIKK